MEVIIEFFQWISDFLGTVIDFVTNFISSIVEFLGMIPTVTTFITSAIGYLPSSIIIYATLGVTVAVTLLVLGRSNN